jgi:hypothetical protein
MENGAAGTGLDRGVATMVAPPRNAGEPKEIPMPEIQSHKPGAFCWAEVGTVNSAKTKSF